MSQTKTELAVQEKELQTEEGTWEGTWFRPDVDIFETDTALTVVADVPGVSQDGFEIDIRDNLLTLTGRVPTTPEGWKPVYTEFETGHFMRQFRLGHHIDQAKIEASFRNGVLTVVLPKAEQHRPRKIEVRAG